MRMDEEFSGSTTFIRTLLESARTGYDRDLVVRIRGGVGADKPRGGLGSTASGYSPKRLEERGFSEVRSVWFPGISVPGRMREASSWCTLGADCAG
jgi:hypothetical protein